MATTTFTDGVTLTAASWFNDVDVAGYAVLSGVAGTNTITATGPANYTLAATRPPVWFIPAATNTGATTIAITPSGGAALTAKNIFSGGAACVGGELVSGVPVGIVYDGTQFNIIGGLTKTGDIDLSTGSLRGVKFDGTQNASTDVNTLDDYEEGPWTPALAFGGASVGITYGTQVGRYIKIGKMVHVAFSIVLTSNGSSSGAATITGLPFAAETITGMVWATGGYAENLSTAGGLICTVSSAQSTVGLNYTDATGAASLTETQITDTANLACSLVYQAAS